MIRNQIAKSYKKWIKPWIWTQTWKSYESDQNLKKSWKWIKPQSDQNKYNLEKVIKFNKIWKSHEN